MATCTACGSDVTGMKFCQQCGAPVATPATSQGTFCPNCGQQAQPGTKFCSNCGSSLNAGSPAAQPTYTPPPQPAPSQPYQSQYGQPQQYGEQNPYQQPPQYSQYPQGQQYPPQPGYGQQPGYSQQPGYPPNQAGYQQQPMMGQPPMVLRCPTCMAMSPLGTAYCTGCRTSLAGVVPTPMQMQQQQQGGLGGLFQGSNGKMLEGALGGAAAVIGGEMLLGGLEHHMDGGYGYGEGYHHREEGPLGELGDLGRDIGLL